MKKISLLPLLFLTVTSLSAQSYKATQSSRPTLEQQLNDAYCSGFFHSAPGTIFHIASQDGARVFLNVLDWLEGRVPGLQVYNDRQGVRIPLIRGNVPSIFVDEVQVPPSMLNSLNVGDIAIIKVIRQPFAGGFNGGNGAIAIYTLGTEDVD